MKRCEGGHTSTHAEGEPRARTIHSRGGVTLGFIRVVVGGLGLVEG